MKYVKTIISFLAVSIIFTSCKDGFLSRTPLDEVSSVDNFNTPDDLRTDVNQFYNGSSFPIYGTHGEDFGTDNQISTDIDRRLEGTRILSEGGGIWYENVRDINYFFDSYKKVEENADFAAYQRDLDE